MLFKQFLSSILRPNGKINFLLSIIHLSPKILDVGCGNNSPYKVKQILPNAFYVGIDICEIDDLGSNSSYNYILASPDDFSGSISKIEHKFDAVISSHNLEHCNDLWGTLNSMIDSLNDGGLIYISFPCSESQFFPARIGTLNYFDDETHQLTPPDFLKIISKLESSNFIIEYSNRRYRPIFLFFIGLILEPISALFRRKLYGTWELYGFESIIWARKVGDGRITAD